MIIEIINKFKQKVDEFRVFVEKTENVIIKTKNSYYKEDLSNFKNITNQKISDVRNFYKDQKEFAKLAKDFEIKNIKSVRDARIKYHEDEIKNLIVLINGIKIGNKDEEEIKQINALLDKLKYENDETNRFYLEKAIERAKKEFDERKQIEVINEQIELHREQISVVKENAKIEIDSVMANYEIKISSMKKAEEAYISSLKLISKEREVANQKAESEYKKTATSMVEISKKTAKAISLDLEDSQKRNVGLIESFAYKYKDLGLYLGSAFSNGFLSHVELIEERLLGLLGPFNSINSSVSNISNIRNLGGITQNFYKSEPTPYEARVLAEDILKKLL